MSVFFVKMTSVILSAFMLVTNAFSFATGNKYETIKPAEDDCKMSFAAVSDLHMQDMSLFEWLVGCGLDDMSKAERRFDAVLFNGDNTNLGSDEEYSLFAKTISTYDVADQTIFTIGNHDSWCGTWETSDRDSETSVNTFTKYSKEISGRDIDVPYYTSSINGYPVIVLGSEGNGTDANISETQIQWFEEKMAEAAETGLPIFVFLHQSINGTHGLPYNWSKDKDADYDDGGIGAMSDRVLETIEKYNNVFYISGHIHAGLSAEETRLCNYVSIEKHDGYTLINLPSYSVGDFFQHGGCWQIGTGYVVEAYEGKIIFRARNFITGTWLSKYDQTIELV